MLTVGKLAKKYNLSRSTLLYYDSIGLLSPGSHLKGEYRFYGTKEEKRLQLICRYREAGIPLKDIQKILDSAPTQLTKILEQRFDELNKEIQQIYQQQKIIASLLKSSEKLTESDVMTKALWTSLLASAGFSEEDMRTWHIRFEQADPDKHQLFLEHLHIDDEEIESIRSWFRQS